MSSQATRVCKDCGVEKPVDQFYKPRPDNERRTCKTCQNERRTANRRANPQAASATARKAKLKRVYGITIEQYDAMLDSQKGVCAICLQPNADGRRLHVDHCHATKRVRGLLCHNCNRALGIFQDDPERLRRAFHYVQKEDQYVCLGEQP